MKKKVSKRKKISKKKKSIKKRRRSSKTKKEIEFDFIWQEYNQALKTWKELFDIWERASNEAFHKYNEACQKAVEIDAKLLKKVNTSLTNSWAELYPGYLKQQNLIWQNVFKGTDLSSVKKINEDWKNHWKSFENDPVKPYDMAMREFASLWLNYKK